jgi:large subunit ribosomal protein L28e
VSGGTSLNSDCLGRNTDILRCRVYKAVANKVAKSGYRPDLRQAAVARASAILKSQRPVKESPEKKLRGKKAVAAAEKA